MDLLNDTTTYSHPTSPDFRPDVWQQVVDDAARTDAERGVARIALQVGRMLSGVRDASAATFAHLPADRDMRVGAYIAYLNAASFDVMLRATASFEPSGNAFEMALHGKIEGLSRSGDLGADDALPALIDSARFTLYELMHRPDTMFTGPEGVDNAIIRHHFEAGQHYNAWSEIWQDVLHRGLQLDPDGSALFYPTPEVIYNPIIAIYRSRRRALTVMSAIDSIWNRLPPEQAAPYSKVVLRTDKTSGCLRFRATKHVPDEAPFQFQMRLMAGSDVSATALQATLPRFGNVTVEQMIACWRVLAGVIDTALEVASEGIRREQPSDEPRMIPFASVLYCFKRLDLIADLANATGVRRGDVAQIVEAMTYRGDKVRALWGCPLVQISDDKLLALNTPFVAGTYLYPLRSWFREGGADLASKGYSFEDQLHLTFEEARSSSDLLWHWRCVKNAKIRCASRTEEVDLLLITGDSVHVIEAKCFLPGYEAREVNRYMTAVSAAAAQATRKATNIAAHRDGLVQFLARNQIKGAADVAVCPILPIVVLYHPLGAGTGDAICPVVDLITVERFLSNELPRPILATASSVRRVGPAEQFYSTRTGADRIFAEYMCNPPILHGYRQQLVPLDVPMMAIDGSPSGYVLKLFDVVPDPKEQAVFRSLI